MSLNSKRELVEALRLSYKQATTTKEKTQLIDAFLAATGHSRKYAISLMAKEVQLSQQRKRKVVYGLDVQEELIKLWRFSGYICGERFVAFIQICLPKLERQNHIILTDEMRRKLLSVSASTCKRLLKAERLRLGRSIGVTRAGTVLRNQIPVRTFADWDDVTPGFFEADLVAHNGGDVKGQCIHTLTLTDIFSGWTECHALRSKQEDRVLEALENIRKRLPIPMLGIDTDNGSEFINHKLVGYCIEKKLTFTRSREYRKNDQAHVEQKNGAVVRRLTGPHRYEGETAYKLVLELHEAARLYNNYFQPSLKLREKIRLGGRVRKRYEKANTPCERLLNSNITEREKTALRNTFEKLDLVSLLAKIESIQTHLQKLANQPAFDDVQEAKPTIHKMGSPRRRTRSEEYKQLAKERAKEKRRKSAVSRFIIHGKVEEHAHKCMVEDPYMSAIRLIGVVNEEWPATLKASQLNVVQRWQRRWHIAHPEY